MSTPWKFTPGDLIRGTENKTLYHGRVLYRSDRENVYRVYWLHPERRGVEFKEVRKDVLEEFYEIVPKEERKL
jgi:hypothetical protein